MTQIVIENAMRRAFAVGVLKALDECSDHDSKLDLLKTPLIMSVVHADKRGAGARQRRRMWHVTRAQR